MKKLKKIVSILAAISMLCTIVTVTPVMAADGNFEECWDVGGTGGNNHVYVSTNDAYGGSNSLHVVYGDEAGVSSALVIEAKIPLTSTSLKDIDILDVNFSFYAKGTLPGANGNFTLGLTNGFYTMIDGKLMAEDDNTTDLSYTIGEADANGWQKVEIKAIQKTVWHEKGTIGGNLSNPRITITGPCDFYADDFSMSYKLRNSDWSAKENVDNLLATLDGGFETFEVTEFDVPEYDDEAEFDADERANSFITEDTSWTVGYSGTAGTTGNNYVAFGDKYAHGGENSMHVVYTDEANASNAITIYPNIPLTSTSLKDIDILDVNFSFYAKGTLPGANGNFTLGLTNGFYTMIDGKLMAEDDNTTDLSYTIGEADANGWQKVEIKAIQKTVWHEKGTIGGNLSNPTITISGPCNFYADDFSMSYKLRNSDWSAKENVDDVLATLDAGFETYYPDPNSISITNFDVVDFGSNEFSLVGENAEVVEADIETLESGYIMASIPVVNSNTAVDLTYYLALYKGNELVHLSILETPVAASAKTTINHVIAVPDLDDDAEYELKAFLWKANLESWCNETVIAN